MAESVAPYHSKDPRDPRVYHVFADCQDGLRIDRIKLEPGPAGLPICDACLRIRRAANARGLSG